MEVPISKKYEKNNVHMRIKKKKKYLFLRGAVKPSSWEVIKRSIGSPVPAKAQAPKGEKFNLSLQLVNLPASRSNYIHQKNFSNSYSLSSFANLKDKKSGQRR